MFLLAINILQPLLAYRYVSSLPIPEDAPVMMMEDSAIRIGISEASFLRINLLLFKLSIMT